MFRYLITVLCLILTGFTIHQHYRIQELQVLEVRELALLEHVIDYNHTMRERELAWRVALEKKIFTKREQVRLAQYRSNKK